MRRDFVLEAVKQYFKPYELVGRRTFQAFGDQSYQVFDTDALECLYLMRRGIDMPFTVNDWYTGGQYDERGFRSNIQDLVYSKTLADKLYLSGHVMGKAFDFKVTGMDSETVRDWIEQNADVFPCKIRLEWKKNGVPISWVHFDTKYFDNNPKVYKFNI